MLQDTFFFFLFVEIFIHPIREFTLSCGLRYKRVQKSIRIFLPIKKDTAQHLKECLQNGGYFEEAPNQKKPVVPVEIRLVQHL
ncbi:hypothetical protein DHB64_01730 [Antarcticibacterium sp. W02-3]|nr:hypothetical protein [Antarcticibacterium sp. W02-3]